MTSAVAAAVLAAVLAPPAAARVLLSVDEALALAFPGCRVERATVYLTEDQLAAARRLAGVEIPGAVVHPYRASCPAGGDGGGGGETVAVAYFDTHRVRTLPETLMVAVDATGAVRRLEVIAFSEPADYLPRGGWYAQFLGRRLDGSLALGGEIRNVTGATLTARATADAVRRVLAIHRLIAGSAPAAAEEGR